MFLYLRKNNIILTTLFLSLILIPLQNSYPETISEVFKKFDLNNDNKISQTEIIDSKENFTKIFLSSDTIQRNQVLGRMDSSSMDELFLSLRTHYHYAIDTGSKNNCEEAILAVGIYKIREMPVMEKNYIKGLTVNILKFINKNIKIQQDEADAENRNACEWSARKVLAAGNFNGCVEAAKLFMELLRGTDKGIECKYVSSFDLDWAKNWAKNRSLKNPNGHAVVEVRGSFSPFLVDASMITSFFTPINEKDTTRICSEGQGRYGKIIQSKEFDIHIEKINKKFIITCYHYGHVFNETSKIKTLSFSSLQTVNNYLRKTILDPLSFRDLEKASAIKYEDKSGSFLMGGRKYIIFEKKTECPYTNQSGHNGSDETTLEAVRKYIDTGIR